MKHNIRALWVGLLITGLFGCDGDSPASDESLHPSIGIPDTDTGAGPIAVPSTVCAAAPGGGGTAVAEPELIATLSDRWHEAWLASPAVADIDGDGTLEIIAPRHDLLLGWHLNGDIVFRAQTEGRIWSSPVVADILPDTPGLEIAVASRSSVYLFTADGANAPGFPVTWRDELRSLAAADITGDGALELVAVTTRRLEENGQRDIVIAFHTDGSIVDGFPPNTTGASGCDEACWPTGGFDQNIALGDVTGNGIADIFVTQDNAYLSLHDGTGRAFDAAPIFNGRTKFLGVRFLHDYDLAQQGWANDEDTANQAHFTNSAPLIADVTGDGIPELVVLGSVQNAAQTDRYRGVALWVLHPDGTRPAHWTTPFHVPGYLAGLWDYDGTNVVGATNQVSAADIHPDHPGLEFVFAGFDGRIHCVTSEAVHLWDYTYTTDDRVLTGGVLIVDLSGDGSPEIIFTTYSPDDDKSHLFILDAGGNLQHRIALLGRGAMPVPTIADVTGDGALEIIVSLKDGTDRERQVQVYTVPSSADNCMPWPTGRGNNLRNGMIPPQ